MSVSGAARAYVLESLGSGLQLPHNQPQVPELCELDHSGRGPLLRPLTPDDGEVVKLLSIECFPIQYPDHWFDYILSNKVYSLAAFSPDGGLMGMVVGELQPLASLETEAGAVLDTTTADTTVMYIVSLGVHSQFRHKGLGSLLVNMLLAHVARQSCCKVVYLHVLATNSQAIEFYRRLGFRELLRVPNYYTIRNKPADGLLYCCYVNEAQPYSGRLSSFLRRYVCESVLCEALSYMCSRLCLMLKRWLFRRKFQFQH